MQYSKLYQKGINSVLWEPRSTRMNSAEGTRYGLPHVVTLTLHHDDQKIILCEEGQAK